MNRIATLDFFKYSNQSTAQGGGDGGEFGGPVCGLDPRYCELPSPVSHPWPPNITDWPVRHINIFLHSTRHSFTFRQMCYHVLIIDGIRDSLDISNSFKFTTERIQFIELSFLLH